MQLQHDATEKGTWSDKHGAVIIQSADGTEYARSDDYQHNRNYHLQEKNAQALLEAVQAALKKPA